VLATPGSARCRQRVSAPRRVPTHAAIAAPAGRFQRRRLERNSDAGQFTREIAAAWAQWETGRQAQNTGEGRAGRHKAEESGASRHAGAAATRQPASVLPRTAFRRVACRSLLRIRANRRGLHGNATRRLAEQNRQHTLAQHGSPQVPHQQAQLVFNATMVTNSQRLEDAQNKRTTEAPRRMQHSSTSMPAFRVTQVNGG